MTSIKNIELGDEVETIGEQAFYACSGLTSITIPNSVIYIGYAAFWCCTNLSSVALHCKEIGSWFSDMTSIKSIELGDEVETIGANAFKGCTNLSSVALHCKEIGSWFSGMTSIKNIELGDEVETIGANAFMNCSGLTSITIPSSVTTIGGSAFLGCTGLTKVSVSDLSKWCGIEFGSDSANPLCNAHHLYLNGNEITALTIPNSVNSIGSYAFCGGTALKSVTFPSSVTWVAQRAFDGCSGLTSVNISDLAAWCQIQFGNSSSNPLSYAHHLYQNGSEVKDLILPSEITAINDNVFTGGSSFTSVTVPSTITNIGSNAFSGCSGLTAVNIADLAAWCQINFGNSSSNPLSYAHHLYQNSKLITELVIPNSVTSMRAYSFSGCTDLTILTIPSSVTSIGYYAFVNCSNITEVNSQIESPFGLPECFSWSVYNNAILNVPKGTKEDYRSTYSWNNFNTIWDGTLEPVEENNDVDYGEGGDVNSGTNLGGNVVGNIYYNIADENGEYSSAEGCIVVRKPTSDTVVDGLGEEDLFGEALKNAYTGIIFMVQPGSGVISVNAETTGGMTLKVKVGDNPPMEIELDGKMKAKFPYSVDKASYVYIYAGGGSAGAKGVDKAASNNSELKIYGIEWSNSTDGVEEIKDERLKMNDSDVYNLNGQKVDGMPTKKGVYIKDGKKVLVK